MTRTCTECGDGIDGRADRRFCSTRCRVAAHRARVSVTPPIGGVTGSRGSRAPRSIELAAAAYGVSLRSVERYKRVRRWAPDLLPVVDAGQMNLHAAEQEARRRYEATQLDEIRRFLGGGA
jgi:hypothetical protein